MSSRNRTLQGANGGGHARLGVRTGVGSKREADRLARYARSQETIAALGQIALESTDLQSLMGPTVSRLAEAFQIEYVEVLELDAKGQSLRLAAGHGWREGMVGNTTIKAMGKSQAGFTLLAKEPVIVRDLRKEKRFVVPSLLTTHKVVSGMTVAINGLDRPYGVLGVHSTKQREFADDDVQFLRAVANVLGAAVRGFGAEQAQRDATSRVHAILSTLVDGVITIDERGMIESLNAAAERLFGHSFAEIVGKNIKMLMPEPYRHMHDEYLANYAKTGIKRIIGIGREVTGLRKDGSTFPMDLAVSELQVRGKRMFTGVVRDVTRRRRMEREIVEAGAEEQRRIGQDLHDGLCQHLAGIAFAAEVLTQKLTARSAPEAAGLTAIGEMIDQAITQARDLARGLQPVTFEANGLASALQILTKKIEQTFHISCLFVSDNMVAVTDHTVASHLYRIAQEGISNAIRHGKAHTVIVDLSSSANSIRLTISDDGIGMEEAPPPSPGMGLRTMDYRAGLIGGTLRVLPGEKPGTRVVCTVPRSDAPIAQEVPPHGKKEIGSRSRQTANPSRRRSSHRARAAG